MAKTRAQRSSHRSAVTKPLSGHPTAQRLSYRFVFGVGEGGHRVHCLRVALLARLTRLRLSARPNRSSGFTMHYNLVRGVSSGEALPGEQPAPPPPDMVSYCDSLVPAHTSLTWMTDEQDMMMMEAFGQPVDQTSDDVTTPQQGDAVLTPHVCTARVLRSGKRPLRPCSGRETAVDI